MARQRLTLHLAAADVRYAETLLDLAGAEALSIRDAGDDPLLEPKPDTAPLWPNVVLSGLFPATADLEHLLTVLRGALPASSVAINTLQDEDWRNALRQLFTARPIGKRTWLAPAEGAPAPGDRTSIRLHMGLAFGTGEHPTTALCLDWLDARIENGTTILDYGCGSGVLAITALALGASHAIAVDTEPQALEATRANAALNGVAERLVIGLPDAISAVAVDVLVANILAGPLIELAPRLAGYVRPEGQLVLSGILEAQASHVIEAYKPYFVEFARATRDGWVLITATRRAAEGPTEPLELRR